MDDLDLGNRRLYVILALVLGVAVGAVALGRSRGKSEIAPATPARVQAEQQRQEAALVERVCNAETDPPMTAWLDQSSREALQDGKSSWGRIHASFQPVLVAIFRRVEQKQLEPRCACGVAHVLRETPDNPVAAEAKAFCAALRAPPANR